MMGDVSEEARALRRCIRDLVALSALPAAWPGREPGDLAQSIAEMLQSLLGADLAYVRIPAGRGAWHEAVCAEQRSVGAVPADALGEVLAPLLSSPVRDSAASIYVPFLQRRFHLLVSPIGHIPELGQAVIGAERSDFPGRTDQLLCSVALNQAAIALQRASLLSSLREANRRLQAQSEREGLLHRIGLVLRVTGDPDEIQAAAAGALGEALGADRCYFTYPEDDGNGLRIGPDFHRGDLGSLAGRYPLPEEDCPGGKTLIPGEGEDGRFPEPWAAVLRRFPARSVLSVPLFESGRLACALTVAMADAPRVWSAEDVSLIEEVAALARQAIAAARMSRREHAIATQLQAALQPALPAACPGLALAEHYRPALDEAEVGGDFYDAFAPDARTTFLLVGDVSGKGLSAASQVATIRNMLRFAICNQPGLAAAVAALNDTLARQSLLCGFATLFVGRFDCPTRTLTFVNCGQEPGLLRRAAGGSIEELPPTGPVLGSFAGAAFGERSVTLAPGDALVLFTDGITEAGPSRSRPLDLEGLAALLGESAGPEGARAEDARALADRLIAGVEAYARGGVRDDQCLLVGIVD